MAFDPVAFIREHTALQATAFVPEIKLYLATEVTPLWQMTELQYGETNLPPPFWAFAWPGGQGLARYMFDHAEEFRGKRVLDFAAGCGLAAIVAHKVGAARSMACDIDVLALASIQMNAKENDAEVEDIGPVNFTKAFRGADIILAGDVCYQQAMSTIVTRWLRLCVESGKRVLMADPGRAWVPEIGLKKLVEYEVPTSRELEDRDSRTVVVWEMVVVR